MLSSKPHPNATTAALTSLHQEASNSTDAKQSVSIDTKDPGQQFKRFMQETIDIAFAPGNISTVYLFATKNQQTQYYRYITTALDESGYIPGCTEHAFRYFSASQKKEFLIKLEQSNFFNNPSQYESHRRYRRYSFIANIFNSIPAEDKPKYAAILAEYIKIDNSADIAAYEAIPNFFNNLTSFEKSALIDALIAQITKCSSDTYEQVIHAFKSLGLLYQNVSLENQAKILQLFLNLQIMTKASKTPSYKSEISRFTIADEALLALRSIIPHVADKETLILAITMLHQLYIHSKSDTSLFTLLDTSLLVLYETINHAKLQGHHIREALNSIGCVVYVKWAYLTLEEKQYAFDDDPSDHYIFDNETSMSKLSHLDRLVKLKILADYYPTAPATDRIKIKSWLIKGFNAMSNTTVARAALVAIYPHTSKQDQEEIFTWINKYKFDLKDPSFNQIFMVLDQNKKNMLSQEYLKILKKHLVERHFTSLYSNHKLYLAIDIKLRVDFVLDHISQLSLHSSPLNRRLSATTLINEFYDESIECERLLIDANLRTYLISPLFNLVKSYLTLHFNLPAPERETAAASSTLSVCNATAVATLFVNNETRQKTIEENRDQSQLPHGTSEFRKK